MPDRRGLGLLLEVCCRASKRHLAVGLYDAEPHVSEAVRRRLEAFYPGLEVSYCWSPPFRALSAKEDDAVVEAISASGVQILFVSLGCPKQERWMLAHRERLDCVAIGVGAAFGMLAGTRKVAPRWTQVPGVEWVFRLMNEPRRLWRCYAKHNVRFVRLVMRQWLRIRLHPAASSRDS
jgi:N-acetylglucosaminyldiphosphoundecaprenol N-acetyl-beta-D-mannosaminyltransferase